MLKRWMDIVNSIGETPGYTRLYNKNFAALCVTAALLLVAEKIHNLTERKARDGD